METSPQRQFSYDEDEMLFLRSHFLPIDWREHPQWLHT